MVTPAFFVVNVRKYGSNRSFLSLFLVGHIALLRQCKAVFFGFVFIFFTQAYQVVVFFINFGENNKN